MKKKPVPSKPKIIVLETREVPVSSLKPYYKNANEGYDDGMDASLDENGQFRSIVVNRGTKTGRRWEVLAGNTTLRSFKRKGWQTIRAEFVDVGEIEAAKINIVDNALRNKAKTNEERMAELLSIIPPDQVTRGTSFTQSEVDDYMSLLDRNMEQSRKLLEDMEEELEDAASYEAGSTTPFPRAGGGTVPTLDGGEEDALSDTLEGQSEFLDGNMQLSDVADFPPGWGRWGVPLPRLDMLATEEDIPEKLIAWAGGASRDTPENDDPEQFWLYNFGISSTSGMKHKNYVLSFYSHDKYFLKWYLEPARWTTKALNDGVQLAISPNFSTWVDDPGFKHLSALFMNRWLMRYFQEAGIKVIPNVEWPLGDKDFLRDYVLKSLPRGEVPVVSMQGNSVVNLTDKGRQSVRGKKSIAEEYRIVAEWLGEDGLIFYYGSVQWNDFVRSLRLPCRVRYVENHMSAFRESAALREKNKGL